MKLLDHKGLAEKGVKFSDTHIWRLMRTRLPEAGKDRQS